MRDPIVVVGGGAAGLGAAARLARQGTPVTLVESADSLGGHGARWACMATTRCQGCGVCLVHDALAEVERSPLVERRLGQRVVAAEAHEEGFLLRLAPAGRLAPRQEHGQLKGEGVALGHAVDEGWEAEGLNASGVVLAAGFSPFTPGVGRPLGAAEHPHVITTVALNEALRGHGLEALPIAGGDSRRLAFLHCVGSRDPAAGRGYCSQVCCGTALRMATRLSHLHPKWQLTLFYIDLQIHGKEARLAWAEERGIRLVQGVPAEIRPPRMAATSGGGSDGRGEGQGDTGTALELVYQAADGNLVTEGFHGAILVVGMEPPRGLRSLAENLGLPLGDVGFLGAAAGTDPRIAAAGACMGPRSIESSLLDGWAAAARIQAVLPAKRRAVFPVAKDAQAATVSRTVTSAAESPGASAVLGTVAVVGRGDAAASLVSALEGAGLPTSWIQPAAGGLDNAGSDAPTLLALTGTVGDFHLRLRSPRGQEEVRCGAVVLCGDPCMPEGIRIPEASGGSDVEIPAVGHLSLINARPDGSDGTDTLCLWLDPQGPAWRPVARDLLANLAEGAETAALGEHLARALSSITLMAQHVALPGLEAQAWYDRARRAGMGMIRLGEAPPRVSTSGGHWELTVTDALLPEVPLRLKVARLLGAGRPTPPGPLARALGVLPDAEGFAPRANVRLAPLRSERTGVYVSGAARSEALGKEVTAQHAALTDELLILLSDDADLAHRETAEIDRHRCVQCLSCLRACPHQAIPMPTGGAPMVSPRGCQACGRCLAVCPALAIRMTGSPALPPRSTLLSLADSEALARATLMSAPSASSTGGSGTGLDAQSPADPLPAPRLGETLTSAPLPGEIPCFACAQGGAPALRQALREGRLPKLPLRLLEVPCIGAVGELALLSALRSGAPRVLLFGCHPGSCAHVDGETRCALRVARLRQSLADMGLPPERILHLAVSPAEGPRLGSLLTETLTETPREGGRP